jgi:hypothetical protein
VTFLEAELAVLIVVLVVCAVLAWRANQALLSRLYDREKALDRHAVAIAREPLAVLREAQRAVEGTEALREDARLLHERVDQKLADLKRGD